MKSANRKRAIENFPNHYCAYSKLPIMYKTEEKDFNRSIKNCNINVYIAIIKI